MFYEKDELLRFVKWIREETGCDIKTAAHFYLGVQVSELRLQLKQSLFDFDHQICMGIRHGLFGEGENRDIGADLDSAAAAIADALSDLKSE